jgi:hypothetical protein
MLAEICGAVNNCAYSRSAIGGRYCTIRGTSFLVSTADGTAHCSIRLEPGGIDRERFAG